jgi:hypothetical protein
VCLFETVTIAVNTEPVGSPRALCMCDALVVLFGVVSLIVIALGLMHLHLILQVAVKAGTAALLEQLQLELANDEEAIHRAEVSRNTAASPRAAAPSAAAVAAAPVSITPTLPAAAVVAAQHTSSRVAP